jgi:hypothetical protein
MTESHGKSEVPSADLHSTFAVPYPPTTQTLLKNEGVVRLAHELLFISLLTCESWPALQDSTSGATWVTRPLFFVATPASSFSDFTETRTEDLKAVALSSID